MRLSGSHHDKNEFFIEFYSMSYKFHYEIFESHSTKLSFFFNLNLISILPQLYSDKLIYVRKPIYRRTHPRARHQYSIHTKFAASQNSSNCANFMNELLAKELLPALPCDLQNRSLWFRHLQFYFCRKCLFSFRIKINIRSQ